ncbi:MAG: YgfZ/GcvT domain-containing protein [Hyphomicrobiaceae bacterium]
MKLALLPDRGVLRVSGADAEKLLQGLITNDMRLLDASPALHAALLGAQGKILFDFFVVRTDQGFLIETSNASLGALRQRLTMYRLRAAANIDDVSADYTVAAVWNIASGEPDHSQHATAFADPRHRDLGLRYLATLASNWRRDLAHAQAATRDDYDALRVGLGIAEAGRDFLIGDAFPHEANYDLTGSVSFTKGCYVGQEVVARMQHKTVVRKRVVRIVGDSLASGAEIKVGDAVIGAVGTVCGVKALAMLRLDRVSEAIDKGQQVTCGGAPISVDATAVQRYRRSVAERPQGL